MTVNTNLTLSCHPTVLVYFSSMAGDFAQSDSWKSHFINSDSVLERQCLRKEPVRFLA